MIIVTPVNALKRIAGVQLVPIGNGRALISLERAHSVPEFELGVGDVLVAGRYHGSGTADARSHRRHPEANTDDRAGSLLEERTIIVFEMKRQRRRA